MMAVSEPDGKDVAAVFFAQAEVLRSEAKYDDALELGFGVQGSRFGV